MSNRRDAIRPRSTGGRTARGGGIVGRGLAVAGAPGGLGQLDGEGDHVTRDDQPECDQRQHQSEPEGRLPGSVIFPSCTCLIG